MPVAYLSPSLLQDLTNVSVSPGAGNTGYPLVWNNTSGRFELAVLGVAGGGTNAVTVDGARQNLGFPVSGCLPQSLATRGTGALTSIGTAATETNPYSVSYDPTGRFVAVTNVNSNTVQTYSVNQSTGALTSIGTAATETNPVSVSYDPTGRFVAVTNLGSNTVQTYSVASNSFGDITASSLSIASLFQGNNLIATGPTVRFPGLPTSSTGLSTGDIWKDGTNLRIV